MAQLLNTITQWVSHDPRRGHGILLLFDILAVDVLVTGINHLITASAALEQRADIVDILHRPWQVSATLPFLYIHFAITPWGNRLLRRFLVAGMVTIAVIAFVAGAMWVDRITARAIAAGYHNCDDPIPEPHQFYNVYVAPGLSCHIVKDREDSRLGLSPAGQP
jgi:hypothetical protein